MPLEGINLEDFADFFYCLPMTIRLNSFPSHSNGFRLPTNNPNPGAEGADLPPDRNPRILVVSEFAPGLPGGGWVILKQLLRGLDWNQVYWWSFFRNGHSHEFGGRHSSCNISSRLTPNLRLKGLKGWILEKIITPYAARHLLSFIRSVQPDFILFLAHRWAIPVVYRVMPHVKTHWHLALHDMPDTAGFVASLGSKRTSRFMTYTEKLYRDSTSRAVISPAMAEDMFQRTGVPCTHIFRCAVEPEILARLQSPAPRQEDDTIRIGYAGTIIAEAAFALLVNALRTVRQRLNRKVEIHLYSWHPYKDRDWFDPSLIVEHGPRSEAEIHAEYQKLTWGLAIMHLDDADPRYNRLSFPCKFTTSLAAGLPLICVGHRHSALIELARNYDLGVLLTDEDTNVFPDKLCDALVDDSRMDTYRSEIARCAQAEFNAERNRQELHGLMNEAMTAMSQR
jgi:glycosyltransferase involved in cell wall biosynthesis